MNPEGKKTDLKNRNRLYVVTIVISLIIVTSLHFSTSVNKTAYHDLFDRLYYIPIIFSAFFFRLWGGITVASTAGILLFIHLRMQWETYTPSQITGRYFEILMYIVMGAITGILSGLEKRQRVRTEDAYQKLRDSFEQAKEAARLAAIGRVSAGVAHEIRNPLGSIKGAVEIIATKFKPESQEFNFITIIEKEIKRINRIVEDFLHLASPRAPDLSPASLNHIMNSVIDLNRENLNKKSITLQYSPNSNLPHSYMDSDQIKQVFLNVVLNSIDFMEEGGSLKISLFSSEGILKAIISDTGGGIKPGTEEHLFEPFYTTRRYGTGMGLAISRQIIEKHGGNISIKNRDDGVRGAVVKIAIPLNPAPPCKKVIGAPVTIPGGKAQ